jgi:hypothetical protein
MDGPRYGKQNPSTLYCTSWFEIEAVPCPLHHRVIQSGSTSAGETFLLAGGRPGHKPGCHADHQPHWREICRLSPSIWRPTCGDGRLESKSGVRCLLTVDVP